MSRVQVGPGLEQGGRGKDWKTMKREAPSHWRVEPLRWKVAAAAVAVAGPVVVEDTAAAAEQ